MKEQSKANRMTVLICFYEVGTAECLRELYHFVSKPHSRLTDFYIVSSCVHAPKRGQDRHLRLTHDETT